MKADDARFLEQNHLPSMDLNFYLSLQEAQNLYRFTSEAHA